MATNVKIKPGEEFLGIGYVAPLNRSSTGEWEVAAGIALVAASIKAILSTKAKFQNQAVYAAGERFMRDDFGSQAHLVRHENLDDDTVALVESYYVDAVERWEPRAYIKEIRTEIDELKYRLTTFLRFGVVGTTEEGNLVIIRDTNGNIVFREL